MLCPQLAYKWLLLLQISLRAFISAPFITFSCSPSRYLNIYQTCMRVVPALKQTIQNSNHKAGSATFIPGIDSAVKLRAKSDFYVSGYVNERILA